jgi:hypothetical protein
MCFVCNEYERPIPPLLEEFDVTPLMEANVPHYHRLIDKEAIEFDGHGKCECKSRKHPTGIMQHGLTEKFPELRKILDKRDDRYVVDAVEATDEF